MKTSESQLKAVNKWKDKNKDKQRAYNDKSASKRFIKKYATLKDLNELKELIKNKENELKGRTN